MRRAGLAVAVVAVAAMGVVPASSQTTEDPLVRELIATAC
jgi:hypothetical protein